MGSVGLVAVSAATAGKTESNRAPRRRSRRTCPEHRIFSTSARRDVVFCHPEKGYRYDAADGGWVDGLSVIRTCLSAHNANFGVFCRREYFVEEGPVCSAGACVSMTDQATGHVLFPDAKEIFSDRSQYLPCRQRSLNFL